MGTNVVWAGEVKTGVVGGTVVKAVVGKAVVRTPPVVTGTVVGGAAVVTTFVMGATVAMKREDTYKQFQKRFNKRYDYWFPTPKLLDTVSKMYMIKF